MSLDISLIDPLTGNELYVVNITHNLRKMAQAAGLDLVLWEPKQAGIATAWQLVQPLTEGLTKLVNDPGFFESFNAPNGWGLYKHFVPFIKEYKLACTKYPTALVRVSV